jgi:hypothetical protein
MSKHAIRLLFAGVCFGAAGVFPSLAWPQSASAPPAGFDANAIGKVITSSGIVSIEHPAGILVQANIPPGGAAQVKTGDLVYRGDVVQTGVNGSLNITFADGTSLTISNNARMELTEFVYDPKGHSNLSLLSLSKGTFTFIAGEIAHTGDLKVDTPIGTLGIRGTAPRIEIADDGTVKITTLVEK